MLAHSTPIEINETLPQEDKVGALDQLTDLVLFELLASLPIRQVMRLMQLGNPRLRRLCSKKWVTDRMTHVDFHTACVAYQEGGLISEAFSSRDVLKRLHGEIKIDAGNVGDYTYFKTCIDLAKEVPGNLSLKIVNHRYLHLQEGQELHWRAAKRLETLGYHIAKTNRLFYMSQVNVCNPNLNLINFPKVIISITVDVCCGTLVVKYRRALLNGRQVVDVWGPTLNFHMIPEDDQFVRDNMKDLPTIVSGNIRKLSTLKINSRVNLI